MSAKTREERNAYSKAYYEKNKRWISAKRKGVRARIRFSGTPLEQGRKKAYDDAYYRRNAPRIRERMRQLRRRHAAERLAAREAM